MFSHTCQLGAYQRSFFPDRTDLPEIRKLWRPHDDKSAQAMLFRFRMAKWADGELGVSALMLYSVEEMRLPNQAPEVIVHHRVTDEVLIMLATILE